MKPSYWRGGGGGGCTANASAVPPLSSNMNGRTGGIECILGGKCCSLPCQIICDAGLECSCALMTLPNCGGVP